jgi:hypothetical protein
VPKYRNILTSPHSIFSGFRKSGFRDLRVQGKSPLGILDAKTPKYQFKPATHCHFGISHVGTSGLVSTRELTLGYPGCRNTEISTLYTLSFRDFACRVSGLASTRELALRYPGCRNTEMSKSKEDHSLSCRVLRLTP